MVSDNMLRNAWLSFGIQKQLMDVFFWDGVDKLPSAQPRSMLFEAYDECWHDTNQTMMKINLLQYRDGHRLQKCDSFLTPNHLISATLEYPFRATACDVVLQQDANASFLRTLPSGGIFPRPCLSLSGTMVDLFSGTGGWRFGLLLAENSMNLDLPPMRFAVDISTCLRTRHLHAFLMPQFGQSNNSMTYFWNRFPPEHMLSLRALTAYSF